MLNKKFLVMTILVPGITYSWHKSFCHSWSSNDFATGQVWAAYSGKGFLPRQYTRIDDIITESQVCVTFLEPLPILDHEIDWKKENIPIVCGKFKVVQILSDLREREEITIARLEEVKGCLTFFHWKQFDGFDLTHTVSQSAMLGFSHRIPAFRVPGIGRYGIPESSWHLEQIALPPKQRI